VRLLCGPLLTTFIGLAPVLAPAVAQAADAPSSQPASMPAGPAPFTPAQQAWIDAKLDAQRQALVTQLGDVFVVTDPDAVPRPKFQLRAGIYIKHLYTNDESQGLVWLGNPAPQGDNITGANGMGAELDLYLTGHPSDNVEGGARIASRFGQLFSDYYENGDRAVAPSGGFAPANLSGQSEGLNHAAYMQLRGVYIKWNPLIPHVDQILVGSSDLGMFNPWTIGRARFIERDNAKGVFAHGTLGTLDWNLARVALPKLYASINYSTGIADPELKNPFWANDAAYALRLADAPADWLNLTSNTSYILDEEADPNDPDTIGSINVIDPKTGTVSMLPRYQNVDSTLEGTLNRGNLSLYGLAGYSFSDPDMRLAYNAVQGNQGITNVPMERVWDLSFQGRLILKDPFGIGLNLQAEYFDIGKNWVSTFGQRREGDVLLTDGFLGAGQLPTLNIANEFMDWNEGFYESIIGWNGATLAPQLQRGPWTIDSELTFIGYNTNGQHNCTKVTPDCPQAIYPDFQFTDGMTDTDFYTYANTNDRGRDPRSVYHFNQDRVTWIGMLAPSYTFEGLGHLVVGAKLKYIRDVDYRDRQIIGADDYVGNLYTGQLQAMSQVWSDLSVTLGGRVDYWSEDKRSGAVIAGVPHYYDYRTYKEKIYLILGYAFEKLQVQYRIEWLDKDVDVLNDPALGFRYRNVVRAVGSLYTEW
jgi:hypothetical protein